MSSPSERPASTGLVVVAFAIVYIVWGSTYFFIRIGVEHIPPMILGMLRFIIAGVLMLGWCIIRGEQVFVWKTMKPAIVSGLLLLGLGNGCLIWSEQYIASSLAAILLASGPIWFLLIDKPKWRENFSSRNTIMGLLVGFAGVILLFGERLMHTFSGHGEDGAGGVVKVEGPHTQLIALGVLVFGSIMWASGSLYSKYFTVPGSSNSVNTGWQMLTAGLAFAPAALIKGEFSVIQWHSVTTFSWLAVFYLVTMGSLAGFSAFVWLLQVRSATQVSTHAYVNPVVAVLLGVLFANESMSPLQLLGLAIILVSVLLINLAKYRANSAQKGGLSPAKG